jgi:hypothetical protein
MRILTLLSVLLSLGVATGFVVPHTLYKSTDKDRSAAFFSVRKRQLAPVAALGPMVPRLLPAVVLQPSLTRLRMGRVGGGSGWSRSTSGEWRNPLAATVISNTCQNAND